MSQFDNFSPLFKEFGLGPLLEKAQAIRQKQLAKAPLVDDGVEEIVDVSVPVVEVKVEDGTQEV